MDSYNELRVLDLRVHPGHRGFLTGGRRGSVVVRVIGSQDSRVLVETDEARDARVLIKQGWRALGCDGLRGSGEEVLRAVGAARREGRDCVVEFEVDADTAKTLGRRLLRKQFARRQLKEALGNRSLEQLGQLTPYEKAQYLQNLRVQWLVVDASAVFEVEVLLERKTGSAMQQAKDLFSAVKRGDTACVRQIVECPGFLREVLLQRDGGGNVALHHAANLEIAQLLVEHEPAAKVVRNTDGRTPVHTYLLRRPEEAEVVGLLAETDRDLLRLDEHGISAAMVMQGSGRSAFESKMPLWSAFSTVLEGDASVIVSALEAIAPEGMWLEIFALHCFGERQVWSKGQHTARSRARLLLFWSALARVVQNVACCDLAALAALEELLRASKGPRCAKFDAREPYRTGLVRAAWSLQVTLSSLLAEAHRGVDGSAVQGLTDLRGYLANDLNSDADLRFRIEVPQWLENHDLRHVYEDLMNVGSVGAFDSRDGIYEMLQLADAHEQEATVAEDDCFLARWFAAWLRGLCLGCQSSTISTIQAALGPKAAEATNFFVRTEPKAFSRICEQLVEIWAARSGRIQDRVSAQALFRQTAAFITDMNACTYVADTAEDLHTAFTSIREAAEAGQLQIRRVDCGPCGIPLGGDPGLTLWLEVSSFMLVELQLQLRSSFDLNAFWRVPCNFFRGRFDWSHLAATTYQLQQKVESEEVEEKRRQEEEERRQMEEERRRAEEEEEEQRRRLEEEEELKRVRMQQIKMRKAEGTTVADLLVAGFTIAEISLCSSLMKEGGMKRFEMEQAGWTLTELKALGHMPAVLRLLFDHTDVELRAAGFTASELLNDVTNFTPKRLRNAGYSARELSDAGLHASELREAGFCDKDLIDACVPLE